MPQEVLNIILSAVSVVVLGLASWGVTILTSFINSKMKDKKMAAFLTKIINIVNDSVKTIFQEFVEILKQEGRFDETKQKQAKEKALQIINSQLTPELIDFVQSNYGDVEAWISNQIEVAIYNLKNK